MENSKLLMALAGLLWLVGSQSSTDIPAVDRAAEDERYQLSDAFPQLTFVMPVELTSPQDNTDRIFVVEQKGVIQVFPDSADAKKSSVFLDIEKQVSSGGEMGLLGLAFHPAYQTNGYFYRFLETFRDLLKSRKRFVP
jgi:hypothetical protein